MKSNTQVYRVLHVPFESYNFFVQTLVYIHWHKTTLFRVTSKRGTGVLSPTLNCSAFLNFKVV